MQPGPAVTFNRVRVYMVDAMRPDCDRFNGVRVYMVDATSPAVSFNRVRVCMEDEMGLYDLTESEFSW